MSDYSDLIIASSPFLYWRLNETSGTTAVDSSGNGHDGTYHGSPTFAVAGARTDGDTAVSFDGVDDYISCSLAGTDFDQTGLQEATIEATLKVPAWADDDGTLTRYSNYSSPSGASDHGWIVVPDNNIIVAGKSGRFAAQWESGEVDAARPTAGEFHHYLIMCDRTALGRQQLLIDCALLDDEGGAIGGGWGGQFNPVLYVMSIGEQYVTPGGDGIARTAGPGLFLPGTLQDFVVYPRLLTETEIDERCQVHPTYIGVWGGA